VQMMVLLMVQVLVSLIKVLVAFQVYR
jgi:hypothetical protein